MMKFFGVQYAILDPRLLITQKPEKEDNGENVTWMGRDKRYIGRKPETHRNRVDLTFISPSHRGDVISCRRRTAHRELMTTSSPALLSSTPTSNRLMFLFYIIPVSFSSTIYSGFYKLTTYLS
ncbi:hypothetical protein K1719_025484 [Acacia pycnantha]|nr:hypothetical protein K1719_025484 [Acacia pycnantha]